jgi:2-oxoglutarate dehydrogenase E2 component (dihydrolipoamide succinyltransferase)
LAKEAVVSSLGIAIEEVVVASILKKEGDAVKENEVMAIVESEKVTFEVLSPADGYVLKINAKEGETFKIGVPFALVGDKEEMNNIEDVAVAQVANVTEQRTAPTSAPQEGQATRTRIYPAAKAMLVAHGLDIAGITGTGPGGVITKNDVQRAIEAQEQGQSATKSSVVGPAAGEMLEERVPMTALRQSIANNLLLSKRTAADVTTLLEVDMTKVLEMRRELSNEKDGKLSTVSFVCKAIAEGVAEFPILNSSIEGTTIVYKKYVNIGVGVAMDKGLVVPVIKNTEQKSLKEIDQEMKGLVEIARKGKMTSEHMKGGTITLSNAGAFGALIATPIINQPESALVWMGDIVQRPVVVDGQIVIRDMMYLCLTYDHRVTDGAIAAQFLAKMRGLLEKPVQLLVR